MLVHCNVFFAYILLYYQASSVQMSAWKWDGHEYSCNTLSGPAISSRWPLSLSRLGWWLSYRSAWLRLAGCACERGAPPSPAQLASIARGPGPDLITDDRWRQGSWVSTSVS